MQSTMKLINDKNALRNQAFNDLAPIAKAEGQPKVVEFDDEAPVRELFISAPTKGFELLFNKYSGVLCKHAVRFVYSKAVAEDIIHDVFFNFWSKKSYQSIKISYRRYLFQCVRNRALNYLRLEFKLNASLPETDNRLTTNFQGPEQHLFFEELHQHIETVIERMPFQRKRIFMLHRFDELSCKEIAEKLNLSVRTVEVHVHLALKTLKIGLNDYLKI